MGLCNSLLLGLGQDQQQHSVVHTGGVSRGEGSMAAPVGVTDM